MKHKYIVFAMIPVLAAGVLGAGIVSAQGKKSLNETPEVIASRQAAMFEKKAALLGVSVDEVKAAWSQGKDFKDLAKEKGLSRDQLKEKMKQAAHVKMQARLKTLVDQGVITQAQADARAKVMEARLSEKKGKRHQGSGHGKRF